MSSQRQRRRREEEGERKWRERARPRKKPLSFSPSAVTLTISCVSSPVSQRRKHAQEDFRILREVFIPRQMRQRRTRMRHSGLLLRLYSTNERNTRDVSFQLTNPQGLSSYIIRFLAKSHKSRSFLYNFINVRIDFSRAIAVWPHPLKFLPPTTAWPYLSQFFYIPSQRCRIYLHFFHVRPQVYLNLL